MGEMGEKPAEQKSFGWGIIGTREIARQFAEDLILVPQARLVASYSRIPANTEDFAGVFGVASYTDIDAFIANPDVNAVFIASANSVHLAQALKALRGGKSILVEKPLAPSHTEASVIQREAKRANVFAMEALWTRFLPAVIAAKAKVDAGELGTIRKITAELAYLREYDAESHYFSRSLGGGASLDLGVYCVSLAMHFLGQPQKVSGLWHAAPSGVDMGSEINLHYDEAEANLSCGFDRDGTNHFVIEGTKGAIRLNAPFLKAQRLTVYEGFAQRPPFGPLAGAKGLLSKVLDRLPVPGRQIEEYEFEGNGLQFEAMAVMEAMRKGEKGTTIMPLSESINALRAINIVLAQPATQRVIKL